MHRLLLLLALSCLPGCPDSSGEFDFDGDGWEDNIDCAPENPLVNPGMEERCFNGIDDDCDGDVDMDDADCTMEAEVTVTGDSSFGEVLLGCGAEHEFQIGNGTGAALELQAVAIVPASEHFTVHMDQPLPVSLTAGENLAIRIEYHPVTAEVHTAVLQVGTDHDYLDEVDQAIDGMGVAADEVEDGFDAPGDFPVDVLMVIDDSCSMGVHQQNLAAIGANVIDTFQDRRIDYHIGFVSIADPALAGGSQAYIHGETVNPYGMFATWVVVGTSGTTVEEPPLETSVAAVTPPLTAPGGTNALFLRDEAALAVVVLTDEDDQSTGTVSSYVDQLQATKDDPADVTFSAIYGGPKGCGDEFPGPRLAEAIGLTGGVTVSICDSDWLPIVEDNPAFEVVIDRFELTRWPVPETIVVRVDDEVQDDGWSYDSAENAVVFTAGSVPDTGTRIVVSYAVAAETC